MRITRIVCRAVLALAVATGPAPGAPAARPPLAATSAVLMDDETGRILYAVAADQRRVPASTTKMLTALLVAEALGPDTVVPISPRASTDRSGAAIGLEVGERWTADELMRAMLMHSANDAAVALAEAVAGSAEAFAGQMTARARALGARSSNFVNPNGRHHPDHYSTAHDLALIGRAALRVPWIAEIVGTRTWNLRRGRATRVVINTNSLLWRYDGADGIKTGWINESGPCLMASATRGGWRLIAVVLDSHVMYRDAAALLTYGFGAFERVRGVSAGEEVRTLPVRNGGRALVAAAGEDAMLVVPKGAAVQRKVFLTKTAAPIAQGETVGTLVLASGGQEVGRVLLVAAADVPLRSRFARLWHRLRQLIAGRP
jgi:D-alanyl-D-alanine carboxypeptidase (penicillin-binding protein 5/6)